MKIGCLGAGTWGFCLTALLASKGYEVVIWSRSESFVKKLSEIREHPKLPGYPVGSNVIFTSHLEDAVEDVDLILESVTSSGIRSVFTSLKDFIVPKVPIVLSSKGIEQKTGKLLSEVLLDVLGEDFRRCVGCLSGPTLAGEVIKGLPASIVSTGYDRDTVEQIQKAFSTERFRVYPNMDITGVEFGGAMKNIIAIACGISDGLGFGDNAKAALMTRGLHEVRKLAVARGCKVDTLNGLAGMGDLCVTCLSPLSRNYRFGHLVAKGLSPEDAKREVGAVVEGAYSCVSALEVGRELSVSLPISEAINNIIYHELTPKEAVKLLLSRTVKEEHL